MTESLDPIVDQAVARLRNEALLPSSDGRAAAVRVLSVTTRPFSYVARVEADSGAGRRRVFVKIPRLKPGKADQRVARLQQEVAAAQALSSAFKFRRGLSVAELVAFFPEIPATVWSEVEGMTLEEMTTNLAPGVPNREAIARLEAAFHGAGRWLRTLQSVTAIPGAELSLPDMIEYVDVRLKRIGELTGQGADSPLRSRVLAVFKEVRLGSADLRLAAMHGDFSLSNVMFDGSRVVAIDFSRFGTGSVYYDVSRMYHQLGLLRHKPWFLPTTIRRLRRALLAGYEPGLRANRPAFRLFLIQHLLCHWQGLLKTSASVSWPTRGFHKWVGYRHRSELDRLTELHV